VREFENFLNLKTGREPLPVTMHSPGRGRGGRTTRGMLTAVEPRLSGRHLDKIALVDTSSSNSKRAAGVKGKAARGRRARRSEAVEPFSGRHLDKIAPVDNSSSTSSLQSKKRKTVPAGVGGDNEGEHFSGRTPAPVALVDNSSSSCSSQLKKRKAASAEEEEKEDDEGANAPVAFAPSQLARLMAQLESNQAKTDAALLRQTKISEALSVKMLAMTTQKDSVVGPGCDKPQRKQVLDNEICGYFRKAVRKMLDAKAVEIDLQLDWDCCHPDAMDMMYMLVDKVSEYYEGQPAVAGTLSTIPDLHSTPYTVRPT
jgi:hypothetical protein